ncbi:amidohydrolase family protein [Streptomyces sp. H27-D2]|uniref:amidohydrolase family protein n=1 Tax=Streptomyces sp. H27-D2 TaxID=3046304 RepID=UPI002DBD970C|nr:amidohydrolase family protein [Streptomyces sp. H27-D2]MEC4019150.1 amidohydrolase family protein [Streptomyces sp. H27-D2]
MTGLRGAVDMCALVHDRESWRTYFRALGAQAPSYLHAFGRHLTSVFGVDHAEYRKILGDGDRGDQEAAIGLLVAGRPARIDLADHLAGMDRDGIAHQVVMGISDVTADGDNVNTRVAALAARAPDRMTAWAGIDLSDPRAAVAEIGRCHALGMRGLAITPFWQGTDPREPRYDQVYGAAEDLGMPIWVHTGHHFSRRPAEVSHPRNVDWIAGRHPRLQVVAGHAAWPWVLEMIAIAQQHRNVHLEFSSHRPSWMARPGSGWEPLLLYGRTTLRRKVMFGSATWVHSVPVGTIVREVADLGLGEEVTHDWLHGNAARLLGREGH